MSELDRIQARADAATEGPWRVWTNPHDPDDERGAAVETAWSYDEDGADTELITDWCHPGDAEFVAHARQDVPRLVAALRAVENLHIPEFVYEYDSVNGVFVTDDDGEKVPVTTLCAECTPDDVREDLGDCEISEGDGVSWPCPTIRAIRDALGDPDE